MPARNHSEHIAAASEEGVKTIVQVQAVELARQAVKAGADAIMAQGLEAGGHTGYTSSTLPLVPAIVDSVGDIPLIPASGIADGHGLAAALMLGAEGVWMGTRFVASRESTGTALSKQTTVERGTDDFMLTRVYDIITNAPFPNHIGERVVRNRFLVTWHGRDDAVVEKKAELKALQRAAETGDLESARILTGNCAGLIHEIEPAGEIVLRIIA